MRTMIFAIILCLIGFVWGFVSIVLKKNEFFYKKIIPAMIFIYIIIVFDILIFGFNWKTILNFAPFIIGMVIGGVLGKILLRQNL